VLVCLCLCRVVTCRRPQSRHQHDGVSLRSLPHAVLLWLDHCCPVSCGWLSLAKSAIKLRHQLTGFDCGVACLLYAEKCGQGLVRVCVCAALSCVRLVVLRADVAVVLRGGA
jgi:hypothetical protein